MTKSKILSSIITIIIMLIIGLVFYNAYQGELIKKNYCIG